MATMTHSPLNLHPVIGGVDTHLDTHTAAVLTEHGALLGVSQFPADKAGYAALAEWMTGYGPIDKVGIEGTGAYGAGLARAFGRAGVTVIEVDRPDRSTRRRAGKSDPIDAENAARAVLSGRADGIPKQHDGMVEALRNLRNARRGAVSYRADCVRRIKTMLITAPDSIRDRFRGLSTGQIITTAAALRPDKTAIGDITAAVKIALRSLARSHQHLTTEITELDELIEPLIRKINPRLLEITGVGPDVAGQLLVTIGDNPDRIRSEAAFAMLCGAAPLPASSGKTTRHRLNRGGDRQANNALWRVAVTRMGTDPRTHAYVTRRLSEGLTKPEIIRCLKRHIARELHAILTT